MSAVAICDSVLSSHPLDPLSSNEWECMVGFFSTTVFREFCITFKVSLIELSIVWSDIVVQPFFHVGQSLFLAWSNYSGKSFFHFHFSVNMVLVALLILSWMSVILFVVSLWAVPSFILLVSSVVTSGMELQCLFAEFLFPVDLLLFFPLHSELSGFSEFVLGDPLSTINWRMTGCSSGLIVLIFLLRRDADILHTIKIPLYWYFLLLGYSS